MIVDCFLFFNEFDILNYRLASHGPYVDKFVILESNTTFTGEKRQLQFKKEKYPNHNIDYYVYDGMTKKFSSPMEMEINQRNTLKDCVIESDINENDILIISDVDEVYDTISLNKLLKILRDKPVRGHLYYNEFFLNLFRVYTDKRQTHVSSFPELQSWFGPWVGRYHKRLNFQQTREIISWGWHGEKPEDYDIVDEFCGYHFTSLFGTNHNKFVSKMRGYAHGLQDDHKKFHTMTSLNYFKHIKEKLKNNQLIINNNLMSPYWSIISPYWIQYKDYIYK